MVFDHISLICRFPRTIHLPIDKAFRHAFIQDILPFIRDWQIIPDIFQFRQDFLAEQDLQGFVHLEPDDDVDPVLGFILERIDVGLFHHKDFNPSALTNI